MNTTHCMHTTQRNTMHSNEMNNVQRCIPVHLKQEYNTATVDDTPQCNSMLSCKQSIEIAWHSSTYCIAVHLKQLTTVYSQQCNLMLSCKQSTKLQFHSSAFYIAVHLKQLTTVQGRLECQGQGCLWCPAAPP